MKKILVLGHNGMLGDAVLKHFSGAPSFETVTTDKRFPDADFLDSIKKLNPDFIINCIGAIPQKKPAEDTYTLLNLILPQQLDTLNIPIVQPTTDCEFSGNIPADEMYTKESTRDATDPYGKSKADAALWIEHESQNIKMIRTSIIGHELNTTLSLLDWFLSQEEPVTGYTNHYWNGITTLEWAKQCDKLITNWGIAPTLTQIGTSDCANKYTVLETAKKVYKKEITIRPVAVEVGINKCLRSDFHEDNLEAQLIALKKFYKK